MGLDVVHSGFTQSRPGGSLNISAEYRPSDTFLILIIAKPKADNSSDGQFHRVVTAGFLGPVASFTIPVQTESCDDEPSPPSAQRRSCAAPAPRSPPASSPPRPPDRVAANCAKASSSRSAPQQRQRMELFCPQPCKPLHCWAHKTTLFRRIPIGHDRARHCVSVRPFSCFEERERERSAVSIVESVASFGCPGWNALRQGGCLSNVRPGLVRFFVR